VFSSKLANRKLFKFARLALAIALTFAFCAAQPGSTTYAKRKPAKYGVLKIRTSPGGIPIQLDGRPQGETKTDDRSFELAPGLHTIVLTLPDGQQWTREFSLDAGRIKCVALNYKPGVPIPTSPCPFPVNLSAPSEVNEGEIITYTADVTYSGASTLVNTWTVTPTSARILSGAGTPTITIDSTGLAGQRIIATLVVDDGSGEAACRQTAQIATFVRPTPPRESPAREFDVCCTCTYDDQKARLDNLAVELQNDPATRTYIIAYGGRNSRAGEADRLGTRAQEYLVSQRGIDNSRITVVNGGFREEDCVEIWLVPRGATPPQPTPTVQPGDVRPPRETRSRRLRP
jgi:hypothetical protein